VKASCAGGNFIGIGNLWPESVVKCGGQLWHSSRADSRALSRATHRAAHTQAHSSAHNQAHTTAHTTTALRTMFVMASPSSDNCRRLIDIWLDEVTARGLARGSFTDISFASDVPTATTRARHTGCAGYFLATPSGTRAL